MIRDGADVADVADAPAGAIHTDEEELLPEKPTQESKNKKQRRLGVNFCA
jgi:hypothetical protein